MCCYLSSQVERANADLAHLPCPPMLQGTQMMWWASVAVIVVVNVTTERERVSSSAKCPTTGNMLTSWSGKGGSRARGAQPESFSPSEENAAGRWQDGYMREYLLATDKLDDDTAGRAVAEAGGGWPQSFPAKAATCLLRGGFKVGGAMRP